MNGKHLVPYTSLDLSTIEERNRWDAWRSFNSGLFEVEPTISDVTQISSKSVAYSLGGAVFGRYSHDPCILRRDASKSSLEFAERVIFVMNYHGMSHGAVGDHSVKISPKRLTMFDLNRSICFETQKPTTSEYRYRTMKSAMTLLDILLFCRLHLTRQ